MRCLAVLEAVILWLNSLEKKTKSKISIGTCFITKTLSKTHIFYEFSCQHIYSSSALIKFLRCHDNYQRSCFIKHRKENYFTCYISLYMYIIPCMSTWQTPNKIWNQFKNDLWRVLWTLSATVREFWSDCKCRNYALEILHSFGIKSLILISNEILHTCELYMYFNKQFALIKLYCLNLLQEDDKNNASGIFRS